MRKIQIALQTITDRTFKSKRNRLIFQVLLVVFIAVVAFNLGSGSDKKSAESAEKDHAHDLEQKNGFWTCSMHPQIKLPKPGKCPICHMDLIKMESDGASEAAEAENRLTLSESAKRLSQIHTVPVERRGGAVNVQMNGKITPDESRIAMITSRVGGRVDRLHVSITGTVVRKGDALALLYSPELMAYQQELIASSVSLSRLGEGASELIRNSARQNLEAAKEKLRLLGFTDSDINNILSRGKPSEHMTIRAVQSGVVLERKVNEGDYVQEGMPLFHIADLTKVWAVMEAYETDLPHLKLGQNVRFTLSAFSGETFSGKISFIDPVIDPMTRIARVRVDVSNKERRLKPEMFLKAEVQSGDTRKASSDAPLIIPATAPLFTGERAVVYVEVSNSEKGTVYEGKEIVLGPKVGESYVVKSGLQEGERVVANGAFRIDSELQIRAKPSMMSPDGAAPGGAHAHHGGAMQTQTDKHESKSAAPVSAELDPGFKGGLDKLYALYLDISAALSADDKDKAVSGFESLHKLLQSVTAGNGKQYSVWKEAKRSLNEVLQHREHYTGIEDLRNAFATVSKQMIALRRSYGSMSKEHYLAFCPMALNDKGAYWLQGEKQIDNPYFGASMLRCGEIKETLEKR